MVGRALGGCQRCGAAGGHHGRRPADVIDQPHGCVLRSPGLCLRHARPHAELCHRSRSWPARGRGGACHDMQWSHQLCGPEETTEAGALLQNAVSTEAGALNSLYRKGTRALPCLSAVGRLIVHERCAVPQGLGAGALSQAAHLRPQVCPGTPPVLHLAPQRLNQRTSPSASDSISLQGVGPQYQCNSKASSTSTRAELLHQMGLSHARGEGDRRAACCTARLLSRSGQEDTSSCRTPRPVASAISGYSRYTRSQYPLSASSAADMLRLWPPAIEKLALLLHYPLCIDSHVCCYHSRHQA